MHSNFKGVLVLLLVPLILLYGCRDLDSLKTEVTKYNIKVGNLTELQKSVRESGTKVEEDIRNSLNSDYFSSDFLDDELNTSVNNALGLMRSAVIEFNDEISNRGTSQMGVFDDGSEEISELNTSEERIELGDYLKVHYFLDDEKSIVEQSFILTLPSGISQGFSLFWVKEGVIGYEEMVID